MNIFLAWSGPASEQLAEFMRHWLPAVIQATRPFMSSEDIRKGQQWSNEIGHRLAAADLAILCLTPANLKSPWIHFEAGAVSRIDGCSVSALLLDVSPTQIEFPLQQFQHTQTTKRDLWRLVRDINRQCKAPLEDARLRKAFDLNFPDLDAELEKVRATLAQEHHGDAKPARSTEAILSDMLAVQQNLQAKLERISTRLRKQGQRRARRPTSTYERKRRIESSPRIRRSAVSRNLMSAPAVAQEFGRVVREYRLARGLSQEKLSTQADVDRTYISQIELGSHTPTVPVLCRFAHAFEVHPAALMLRLQRGLGAHSTQPLRKAAAARTDLN